VPQRVQPDRGRHPGALDAAFSALSALRGSQGSPSSVVKRGVGCQAGGGARCTIRRSQPHDAKPVRCRTPSVLIRQGPVLHDTFHDEGGAEALDAGESGEAVAVELLVGGQVAGDMRSR
jgi:hypothetical protein